MAWKRIATPDMLEKFRVYATRNNPEMLDPLYVCHMCRDTGYEQVENKTFDHMTYEMFDACAHCEKGRTIMRGRVMARMKAKIQAELRKSRYRKTTGILEALERKIDMGIDLKPEDFKGLGDEDERKRD